MLFRSDLYRSWRCQKPRRKRYGAYDRRGRIPNQVSIEARPAVVETRGRIGDWEGDTVIGKGHRGVLVTLVERKSRYTVIRAIPRKTAAAVRTASSPATSVLIGGARSTRTKVTRPVNSGSLDRMLIRSCMYFLGLGEVI